MKISECPYCHEGLKVGKVKCIKCGISLEGEFYTSPLLGLSEDEQTFVELFVLSSGSLKEMAEIQDVTYPTIRVRMDQVIASLKREIRKRNDYKKQILEKVKEGKISPEKAAEIIKKL